MKQIRTMKRYSSEFKEEAVALVNEHGYSVPKAAEAVGVSAAMLYKWKDKLEAQACGTALSVDEREELNRLRKECRELRMEKEILKKASAFFAKEMK